MLTKLLKAQLSTGPGLQQLKQSLKAPVKHIKRNLEPSGVNYSRMTNTTDEAFDEVAHEWQALLTNNPFDVNVFNYLENAQAANFGTVDNPLVVFTSETPFRYVGCTGQMNEDDYEGHEMMYFMLREGPLQRCMGCGQVFKLVRLRNEYSPEMDYYLSNFHSLDSIEFGESDTAYMMSPWKYSSHYDYSQFETPSNMVYSMINPDEHDRLLVDPAYRLERTKALEEKTKVFVQSLQEVERRFEEKYGNAGLIPMSKTTFETMIDVEKAIRKLDRTIRKVARFDNRAFLDRANHERREKRMREKEALRWESNYAYYTGSLTEQEQKYRDYYQTELENYPEDEVQEQLLDEQEILQGGDYNLSRYDFQEQYTKNIEDDQSSLLQKKIFKFKYRMASDSVEDYNRRNNRMVQRQLERIEKDQNAQNIFNAISNNSQLQNLSLGVSSFEQQYIDFILRESVNLHNDYYETDGENMHIEINNVSALEKTALVQNYQNHLAPKVDNGSVQLIPKRQWQEAFGVWENLVLDYQEYKQIIQPRAHELSSSYQASQQLPLSRQELIEAGLLEDKSQ